MNAVVYRAHGGLEVLDYRDVPLPVLGPTDVLVRVKAVALNHIDLWIRRGLPRLRVTFPHIPGADVTGTIERSGERVTTTKVGDAVVVAPGVSCGVCRSCLAGEDNLCPSYSILGEHRWGGYAEYVVVPEVNILPKPARLTFEEAAAIPLVFLTAWNMLVTHARLRPGEAVLIWGVGSGVGSAGLQIAKLIGARVIAVAGDQWKLEKAKALGADEGIDYREASVIDEVRRLTDRRGVEVVFDHVGTATWQTSLLSLSHGGRLVTCGATTGYEATTDLRYIYGRRLSIHGTWVGTKRELYEVMTLVDQGRLNPVIYRIFPLHEAAQAQELLERSGHFGKVVLTVAEAT